MTSSERNHLLILRQYNFVYADTVDLFVVLKTVVVLSA